MNTVLTHRGFRYAAFVDRYGEAASIQESSLATESAIWLGLDKGTHHLEECSARMHLTQEMAAELIPMLQHFVETGYLPDAVEAVVGADV